MEEKIKGKCKWWDVVRGYGFLTANGKDYFCHRTAILGERKILFEGDECEFFVEETAKGLQAIQVSKIN
jgi:CspA family cold shock protein